MKKAYKLLMPVLLLSLTCSNLAWAGEWKSNSRGYYWQDNDGSSPMAEWRWLDGDRDGVFERYYFDQQGYLLTSAQTPDGEQVDADGRWTVDGVIKTKEESQESVAGRALYEAAVTKTSALNSYIAGGQLTMTASAAGESLTVGLNREMKVKDKGTSAMKYVETMTANNADSESTSTLIYTNGVCYTDVNGVKNKSTLPMAEMVQQIDYNPAQLLQRSQYLENYQITETDNGNRLVHFTCTPGAGGKMLQDSERLGAESILNRLHLRSYYGTATIDAAGYITALEVFKEFADDTDRLHYNVELKVSYTTGGQQIDFELPSTSGY